MDRLGIIKEVNEYALGLSPSALYRMANAICLEEPSYRYYSSDYLIVWEWRYQKAIKGLEI